MMMGPLPSLFQAAWAVALLMAITSPGVLAFKLKTHVIIADRSLAAISGAPAAASIDIAGIGPTGLHNAEVVEAVRAYPRFYRAGTLGPDAYPDLIGGQLWVHVNKGNEDVEECAASSSSGCIPNGVPFEARTFDRWRAIDNGMYILKRANEYYPSPATPAEKQR